MENLLSGLTDKNPKIKAIAVTSIDGLVLAQRMRQNFDEDLVSAMSAAVFTIGRQVSEKLIDGDMMQIVVRSKHGVILVVPLSAEILLVAITQTDFDLQQIILEISNNNHSLSSRIIDRQKNLIYEPEISTIH